MKISNISKRKFENLENLEIPREVTNTEAHMYKMETPKGLKVVKKLYILNGPRFANKLYTLEMLNEMKEYLPSSIVIPDSLLSVSDEIRGFTMPYIEGKNLSSILSDKKVNPKECIYFLKEIGYLLEQLQQIRANTPLKDFYINDLHDSNFIINPYNKDIHVVDLDSCKIGSNQNADARFKTCESLISSLNYKYHKETYLEHENIIADQNTDLYCYTILILNYLYGSNISNVSLEFYFDYIDYLQSIGISNELLEVFRKVTYNCENENPVYYLDSITDEQVYRAREKLYKLNRNK